MFFDKATISKNQKLEEVYILQVFDDELFEIKIAGVFSDRDKAEEFATSNWDSSRYFVGVYGLDED